MPGQVQLRILICFWAFSFRNMSQFHDRYTTYRYTPFIFTVFDYEKIYMSKNNVKSARCRYTSFHMKKIGESVVVIYHETDWCFFWKKSKKVSKNVVPFFFKFQNFNTIRILIIIWPRFERSWLFLQFHCTFLPPPFAPLFLQ